MMHAISLLAASPSADIVQFARLHSMTQWWHWITLAAICVAIVGFVVLMYRRDAFEMARGKRWALLGLRIAAFVGILIFFLDLEKRSQQQVVQNSRVVVLVDTSLSMGIQDAETKSGSSTERRIDRVIGALRDGQLLAKLHAKHDIVVSRFDDTPAPIDVVSLPKRNAQTGRGDRNVKQDLAAALVESRTLAGISAVILVVSCLSLLVYLVRGRRRAERDSSWSLLIAMVGVIAAVVIFSVANLRHPDIGIDTLIGLAPLAAPATRSGETRSGEPGDEPDPSDASESDLSALDWPELLAPRGGETRMGDAIRSVLAREQDGTLAGIVLLSDGGNNAGTDIEQAISVAEAARVPIYAVGLGGAKRPANVRVVDIEAPPRVYPGDSFTVNGYLQSFGFAGRTVRVELRSNDARDDAAQPAMTVEEEVRVRLGDDGEMTPIRFEVVPREQGTRNYELRVVAPDDDHDQRDNQRSAKVQIVARKNRVLLLAGGPTREFRFLRDLLFRDRDTTLHVFLQTGQPGLSQESDRLLSEFPSSPDELFEYDCIVAFDPDWLSLESLQIDLLERWVSEEAGGLIVVAGPVHTPQWANRLRTDARVTTIKNLYPVIFFSRGSATLQLGRFASETPWPLAFTRDGQDAEFLWFEDDALLSQSAWESFSGVYGYYAVKDPKPGARVYARFSDPNTAIDGDLPIYMAGHFYGAGRVFFQASGEMWRVRSVDDAYFEKYYTKLLRWASQGRLLRDSSRGVLLVDKARCLLGDHVAVRAILTDAQHKPLVAEQVTAALVSPDGRRTALILRRITDAVRGGMFTAQFTATLEGDYRIELQPPHGNANELLTREVRSRIPALETERPERNDVLLKLLTDQTDGDYYIGFATATGQDDSGLTPVFDAIDPQDKVSYVAGTPDRNFERLLMTWLMGMICGVLCLEWLIRRLSKLA